MSERWPRRSRAWPRISTSDDGSARRPGGGPPKSSIFTNPCSGYWRGSGLAKTGRELLFHVFAERYERSSVLEMRNPACRKWLENVSIFRGFLS
jgi:hypothetical protein